MTTPYVFVADGVAGPLRGPDPSHDRDPAGMNPAATFAERVFVTRSGSGLYNAALNQSPEWDRRSSTPIVSVVVA
jgi:hypothetical protein